MGCVFREFDTMEPLQPENDVRKKPYSGQFSFSSPIPIVCYQAAVVTVERGR